MPKGFIFAPSMFSNRDKKRSLRFRQWRRKSYAAFHSIGRHVTIGNIKNIVADTLLGKQKTVAVYRDDAAGFPDEQALKEPDDPITELQAAWIGIPAVLHQPCNKKKNIYAHCSRAGDRWPNML